MSPATDRFDRLTTLASAGRARIGRARRIAGILVLAALGLTIFGYQRVVVPDRLLPLVRDHLTDLTCGDVEIGRAEFRLFRGIYLTDVRILLPPSSEFVSASAIPRDREIFRATQVHLRHDPLRLLLGRVRVRELTATGGEFTIVRRVSDGRYNWFDLCTRQDMSGSIADLPTVRLNNVSMTLRNLFDGRYRDLDRIELSLVAEPDHRERDGIVVRWRQRGFERKDGVLALNLRRGSVEAQSGGLPTMNIEAMLAAMPGNVQELARWLTLLDVRGRLGVEALSFDPDRPGRATIQLNDLAMSIPLDEQERRRAPAARLLRLYNVSGRIHWSGDEIETDLLGELNGQACSLYGTLCRVEGEALTWDSVGLDLALGVERFRLPKLTENPADASSAFIRRFPPLLFFYELYDPHGEFQVELDLTRDPRAEQDVRLRRARIVALGADARYHGFPVRVRDLEGELEYTDEGITVRGLRGRYGEAGTVLVDGTARGFTAMTGVDLHIRGENLPLDDEMYAALHEDEQRTWRMFAPEGNINLNLSLSRPHSDTGRGFPWNNHVTIEFLGVDARFAQLPYPLSDVRGIVRIDPEGLTIESLEGRHGRSVVRATGTSLPRDGASDVVDVQLAAQDLEIDAELIAALPEDAREAVEVFGLSGRLSLEGRIFTDAQTDELAFDLAGTLADAAARHRRFPVPVEQINGGIRLRPGSVELHDWRGLHGRAPVRASGTIYLPDAGGEPRAQLALSCDAVALTDDLRDSLPPDFAHTWQQIGAEGSVRVELDYQDHAAVSDAAPAYRLTIEPLDLRVRPSAFPWTFEDVTGRLSVTPQRIDAVDLRARHGSARVRLDGSIDRGTGEAVLALEALSVDLDEDLRQAVPWRVRRQWNVLEPAGRIDLRLPELTRRRGTDGTWGWSFRGEAALADVTLDVGAKLRGATGLMRGHGTLSGQEMALSGDADVQLARCHVNQYALSDARFRLLRTASPPRLVVSDLVGAMCGGRLFGRAEVQDDDEGGRYDFSVFVEGANLGPLLARRDGAPSPTDALQGTVEGSLYYSGLFDRPERSRGGGEVRVQGGAMFRVPLMLQLPPALAPLPAPGPQQDAFARFFVTGGELILESMQVRDRNLLLSGGGKMNLANRNLDLVLVAGAPTPGEADTPITVMQEFLEGAARELVEVRIIGTLAEPQIEARPLRGIDQAIRVLSGADERGR